jgi:MFS-type transporter involved in bile tolerance (Atg22 family)
LVWWLTRTIGSATVLAAASTFAILPEIIINPFAGIIVDRFNRNHVMISADAAIAMATLGLIVLVCLDLYRNGLFIKFKKCFSSCNQPQNSLLIINKRLPSTF